ncbi:hypothetical protein Syun_008715 [Stephania yunnanensis]|uniref:RNA exonuclease 4 n=1 Tax=Stephania yunnanensis TaxID=152371 RepID=A0AAP0KD36_9MAGN
MKNTNNNNNNKKRPPINPNWAQLQQKLKTNNPSKPKEGKNNPETVLGKRKERSEADSNVSADSALSVLIPSNNDSSVTDAIAMDCEMVGVSSQGNKSALGRVTMVNSWGNVVYDEYVQPVEYVVDFRTAISGIRPRHLKKAKDFWVVQKEVAELIKGKTLVGHALHNDFKVLLLSHPKKDTRDTSEYQPFQKEGPTRSLRKLADEFLGVKIQLGEHCSIEDARAAMMLYQRNKKEWERSVKDHLRFKEKRKKFNRKKRPKARDATNLNSISAVSLH